MDRAALFHAGISNTRWPVRLYRLDITRVPEKTP
jgi:hypothetical protein